MTRHARRAFVKKASLLCGVSLFASANPGQLAAWDATNGKGEGFESLFSDPAGVARIARAYLATVPDAEASAAALKAAAATCTIAHGDALRRFLRDRIETDFSHGNTVILDGWVLARSEVNACLLAQQE